MLLINDKLKAATLNREVWPECQVLAAWHSIMSLQVYLLSTWEKKQPADHDKALRMAECRILESAAGCRGLQKAEPTCQLEVHVNYKDIISHPAERSAHMPTAVKGMYG